MPAPRPRLRRLVVDPTLGLRVAVVLAVVAVLVALLVGRGAPSGPSEGGEPGLTAESVDAYVAIARDVRLGRREAREAGWQPQRWAEWPRISGALRRAGWSMEEYLRVEGRVAAARLAITDPGLGTDPDDPHSRPVPEADVAIVRERLGEVSTAQAPLPVSSAPAPAPARPGSPPPP